MPSAILVLVDDEIALKTAIAQSPFTRTSYETNNHSLEEEGVDLPTAQKPVPHNISPVTSAPPAGHLIFDTRESGLPRLDSPIRRNSGASDGADPALAGDFIHTEPGHFALGLTMDLGIRKARKNDGHAWTRAYWATWSIHATREARTVV